MWMGKPCCSCDGDCVSGIFCVSTYNLYTGAPTYERMTMAPYGTGETPRCIDFTFSDIGAIFTFSLDGTGVCPARSFNFDSHNLIPCGTFSTGIATCRTSFTYEEEYDPDGFDPCDPPTIAVVKDCPEDSETGYSVVLGFNQYLGNSDSRINGSSISVASCLSPETIPPGTLSIMSCFDEAQLGITHLSGKTLGYQSPYGGWPYNLFGTPKNFYLSNCTETTLVNCSSYDVTVPKELYHSCDEFWDDFSTNDDGRFPYSYNACCPDPITAVDSLFKTYAEDDGCICSEYTLKASPCFTPEDYTLSFNGSVSFSGHCYDFFGQGLGGGACFDPSGNALIYEFTVDGPIALNNTGSAGSHTNQWVSPNPCCSDFSTPIALTLTFCGPSRETKLYVEVCGRGEYGYGLLGFCACPVLGCPSLSDIGDGLTFSQMVVCSGNVISCNPIDIDFYDPGGNLVGSITQ